jgi:hypothetical protein
VGQEGQEAAPRGAHGSDATTMGTRLSQLTQLRRALERPLEAQAYSTTC